MIYFKVILDLEMHFSGKKLICLGLACILWVILDLEMHFSGFIMKSWQIGARGEVGKIGPKFDLVIKSRLKD